MWTALRLPVLAQEAAAERLANLKDDEARCLELLKKVGKGQGERRRALQLCGPESVKRIKS